MKYGSVCSGIEAATQAWHPLGWEPQWFAEIEPFPSAVLAARWPAVPNLGDMTTITDEQLERITDGLLVGGTPCQSFSVAGLRKGLDDPRGNLALWFLRLADRARPRWVVWENVPGVLSSGGGRDFGTFLGALGKLGYGWCYRVLDAQFVRVQSHPYAVPQRRRRVFVVGYLGDWRRAAAVLLERESMCGHPAPRREAGKGVAALTAGGVGTCGADDNQAQAGHLISQVAGCLNGSGGRAAGSATNQDAQQGLLVPEISRCLESEDSPRFNPTHSTLIPMPFDPNQVTSWANRSNPQPGDPCHTIPRGAHAPAVAIQERAVSESDKSGPQGKGFRTGSAYALEARHHAQAVGSASSVRRLTPRECERLQGFPDNYTAVECRGKPAADGPRYKALGNSMAVNAMSWIGERIQMVSEIPGGSSTPTSTELL